MTATARQAIPVVRDEVLPSFRQSLIDSFDAARRVMQETVINEHGAPGAMQTLLDWAAAFKFCVIDKTDRLGTREVSVYLGNGSVIRVIRAVPATEEGS